jgi:hypothetical protein
MHKFVVNRWLKPEPLSLIIPRAEARGNLLVMIFGYIATTFGEAIPLGHVVAE